MTLNTWTRCIFAWTALAALLALSSEAQQAITNDKVPDEPKLSLLDSPFPPYLQMGAKCPYPDQRSAEIGGSEISASFMKHQEPIPGARAKLFAGERLVWRGATGREGTFTIRNLAPGLYTLQVEFWGTTTVRLNSKLTYPHTLHYNLFLTDNACISWGAYSN